MRPPGYVEPVEQHVGSCPGPGGEEIAFAIVGSGPVLVLAAWWTSHLELDWQNDELRGFVQGLAENHTVVRYDRPGVGMSSRAERTYDLATEVATLEAVVEATGADQVDLLGISCGGPPCVHLAQRHPELVRRMVFFGSYLTGTRISDAPTRKAVRDLVASNWGLGSQTLTGIFLPDSDRPTARRFSSAQRHTATAEVAANLLQLTFDMDVAEVAPQVSSPSLVLHRRGDNVVEADRGKELADALPDADFRMLDGRAHLPWAEGSDELIAVIDGWLTGGPAATPATRRLATVVFVDIVESTRMLDRLGDEAWRHRLDELGQLLADEAASHSGVVVKDTGDGAMLTFELPGDAIAFALAVSPKARKLELGLRGGVHTGEVEVRGTDITGRSVVIASRLCDLAPDGGVYVSATAAELAAGRGIAMRPVGPRDLKGVPDPVTVLDASPDDSPPLDPTPGGPRFTRAGGVWQLDYDGTEATVRHSKGVGDLATLVSSPGRDIDVVELMDGPDTAGRASGDEVLDRPAIEAYRRRLGEIESELDQADARGDTERSARLDEERGALIDQLRTASGLGGRTRRMGDDVERARKAVSGRIRDAIAKITDVHPTLGGHLSEQITTGRCCRYR